MASFDAINYSLRPSKSIQRQLVFSGVAHLLDHLDLDNLVYVGFGSVWFTDFLSAHRILGVDDMISIENHPIGYQRALYNSPFATVRVEEGLSTDILPKLRAEARLAARPWMIWLDYDGYLDEGAIDDLRWSIENAPENSILLTTFNGHEMNYGRAPDRVQRLRDILGDVVPDDLSKSSCQGDRMQETIATLCLDFLRSAAIQVARPGGFVPAFRILYRDSAPMVTVGGLLPSKGAASIAKDHVSHLDWPACPAHPIHAPHLTMREAASLQALLPRSDKLTRAVVQRLGFDLEEDQIEAFQRYYLQYPAFAQIVA